MTLRYRAWFGRSASLHTVRLITPRGLPALEQELRAWERSGRTVKMWWRDDDAIQVTPALDRLIGMAAEFDVPVALAVIPARADTTLVPIIRNRAVAVLQHGWDHTDHSGGKGFKAELAPGRNPGQVRQELALGWTRLDRLFDDKLLPVLVPPFNQLAPHLADVVAESYQYASFASDFSGIRMRIHSVNIHCNMMDWRTRGSFSEDVVVLSLVTALKLRRFHLVTPRQPVGILTHHLDHNDAAWSLLRSLLVRLRASPAVKFPALAEIFNAGRGDHRNRRRAAHGPHPPQRRPQTIDPDNQIYLQRDQAE